MLQKYFWNYNTIEATLLACAVFVCLAGIMFESSQFDDRPDLIWMQDMIAVVVAIAIGSDDPTTRPIWDRVLAKPSPRGPTPSVVRFLAPKKPKI